MLISIFYLFSLRIGLLPLLINELLAVLASQILLRTILGDLSILEKLLLTAYISDFLVACDITIRVIKFVLDHLPSMTTNRYLKLFLSPWIIEKKRD